jgi:hypothetical protein
MVQNSNEVQQSYGCHQIKQIIKQCDNLPSQDCCLCISEHQFAYTTLQSQLATCKGMRSHMPLNIYTIALNNSLHWKWQFLTSFISLNSIDDIDHNHLVRQDGILYTMIRHCLEECCTGGLALTCSVCGRYFPFMVITTRSSPSLPFTFSTLQ